MGARVRARNLLYLSIVILVAVTSVFYFLGKLDAFQFFQIGISAALLYTSILMSISARDSAEAARLQVEAMRLQVEASEESLKASVAPKLVFFARRANDYWRGAFGLMQNWKPGVGIYIENVGLGAAVNVRLVCKVVGKNQERSYNHQFPRLSAGGRYTIPSVDYPDLEVKPIDTQIIIETIEYEDIRAKTTHYKQERTVLDLEKSFFEEPDRLE